MFGYINVNKDELKFREYDVYRSYYCGLCSTLKDKYGRFGQISLSYDMTFLVILLSGLYEPKTDKLRSTCIVHPIKKHDFTRNEYTEYVADMNILLTYYKCMDDWKDEKKVFRKLYAGIINKKFLKDMYVDKIKVISDNLNKLSIAEKKLCTDVDYMAGLFGETFGEIFVVKKDEWEENLRKIGFYLGKFIYILDAYEDMDKDKKNEVYNPFLLKNNDKIHEIVKASLLMIATECAKEFEKLPIIEDVGILRNIIYSGIWTRYEMIKQEV